MDASKTALAVLCGAIGGCFLGAGYVMWRGHRHGHHGHGHGHDHGHGRGPFSEGAFDDMMAQAHYGDEKDILEKTFSFKDAVGYYSRIAELCRKYKNEDVPSRALDIGCSLGRTTFDLALLFDEVIGMDSSAETIKKANNLKEGGEITYNVHIEGDISKECVGRVNPDIDRSRATFVVGDACNLSPDLGQFGMIVVLNAMHHFPDPKKFLLDVDKFLAPGGILVIGEMYIWHDMLDLPKDRWIGGFIRENGEKVQEVEGLKEVLSGSFELLETKEMPAVAQWKLRMFMVTFTEVTIWKRK